ncbi:MAG TPA: PAS domain S-box protein [Candidatus Sulfotelmatobacter sp.]|nr:PAS domain S-box protein [Candidatus Sulfotelmatobacter sp.]
MPGIDKKSQEAFEERARLLDLANDAIIVRDAADRITFWNKGATAMYGFSREEALGRVSHELFRTEFPEPIESINEKLLRDGHWSGELRHVCATGAIKVVSTRWVVERDESGKLRSVLESNRDITEAKRAAEAQSRLAAIVESSDDAIVSKDLDGIITSWNKAAERIFGYTANEAIGQSITLIIPPDRKDEEKGILARISRGERIEHFETVRQRKDGTRFHVSVTISPVRGLSGQVIGASKVARDITAQKRTEQALRESQQLYQAVTDASPVMIWLAGTDNLCYYFNKGWLNFVGRTLEQEAGNGWTENVHPDDFDRCVKTHVKNFDARSPFEMEYRLRHRSGQYRWIFDRGVPRYAPDGTFEGYVGGCLDMHDRKEATEKIRIADESVRLLKVQDEERRRIAREFHDSAGQTLTVLGLSLTQLVEKAETTAPELAKEGKEIEEVVQQLHREIRTTSYLLHPPLLDEAGVKPALSWYIQGVSERSGIAIELNISENLGRLPAEMELAIFRVVQECLTNIHRHAESKTARIRIAREKARVRIEVRDEGKGISPQRLEEIQTQGSGVGIGGIRERLRRFHGEMKIESNSSGTVVSASIPIPNEARLADIEPLQAAV